MTQRDRIVQGASALFLDHSLKGVTMDTVAKELGMSKRTIYENFVDKQALVRASIDHLIDLQLRREQEILDESETIVDELFAMYVLVDQNFMRMGRFANDVQRFYPEIFQQTFTENRAQSIDKMSRRLERGIRQCIIRKDTNVEFVVLMIQETLNTLLVLRYDQVTQAHLSLPEAFKYVLTHFFRGIATTRGIEMIDSRLNK